LISNDIKKIRIRVCAILIEKRRILFVAHKKGNDIYWLLPGGGVKFGESLEEALIRELKEELTILVKINDVALISDSIDPMSERHILNICFNCICESGEYLLGLEKRLHNFGFFNQKELHKLTIFPPIKKELSRLLRKDKNFKVYLGQKWINPS